MISDFTSLFDRDLDRLSNEIDQYHSDSDLWIKTKDIPNSAGNLCLHICGNLLHFIGFALGNTDYQRDREKEFGDSNLNKDDLLELISNTREVVYETLSDLDNTALKSIYPLLIKERKSKPPTS